MNNLCTFKIRCHEKRLHYFLNAPRIKDKMIFLIKELQEMRTGCLKLKKTQRNLEKIVQNLHAEF